MQFLRKAMKTTLEPKCHNKSTVLFACFKCVTFYGNRLHRLCQCGSGVCRAVMV